MRMVSAAAWRRSATGSGVLALLMEASAPTESAACWGIQMADKGDDDRTRAGQAQFDQRPNSLGRFARSTSKPTRPSSKTWSSNSWG